MEKACIAVMNECDEVVRYESFSQRYALGSKWVATFQEGMGYLARQGLTGEQWSVYAYLVEHLDYDNWVRIKQQDISDDLGIQRPNVSRALAKLVEVDVIAKGPLAGRCNTYRMNPRIAHRGSKHYKNNIIQYDALKERREKDGRTGDGWARCE